LISEGRHREAVVMFEEARVRGKVNRTAMDGIREALQTELRQARAANDAGRAEAALLALRSYFPGVENLDSFTIDPFGRPLPVPPTLAPREPPPPAIPEEGAKPRLHEFERKELQMAPGAPAESAPPGTPPRRERPEPNARIQPDARPSEGGGPEGPLPGFEPPLLGEKPAQRLPVPQPAARKATAQAAPDSSIQPGQSRAALAPPPAPPAKRSLAAQRPEAKIVAANKPLREQPGPQASDPLAPALPQDVPPGFTPPTAVPSGGVPSGAAQAKAPAESRNMLAGASPNAVVETQAGPKAKEERSPEPPAMKGLWPVGNTQAAGSLQKAPRPFLPQRPAPPPSFRELAEAPPTASAARR
jgi:hypothetical protein